MCICSLHCCTGERSTVKGAINTPSKRRLGNGQTCAEDVESERSLMDHQSLCRVYQLSLSSKSKRHKHVGGKEPSSSLMQPPDVSLS